MLGVNPFAVSRSYRRRRVILPYSSGKYIVKQAGIGNKANDHRGILS